MSHRMDTPHSTLSLWVLSLFIIITSESEFVGAPGNVHGIPSSPVLGDIFDELIVF